MLTVGLLCCCILATNHSKPLALELCVLTALGIAFPASYVGVALLRQKERETHGNGPSIASVPRQGEKLIISGIWSCTHHSFSS